MLHQVRKLSSLNRKIVTVGLGRIILELLVEAHEFTPFNVIVKMEDVELFPESLDLPVESDGFFSHKNQLVLELSQFFDELLEFVVQLSGLLLVLADDLGQVVDLSLVELGLALERIDSVAEDVALGEAHLVDLDKHLKLLEVEQEGLVLGLDLPAECLYFVEVHIRGLGVEVTLELFTDVGYSLTRRGAEGTGLVEALDHLVKLGIKDGVRFSELLKALFLINDTRLFGEEVSDNVGLSG